MQSDSGRTTSLWMATVPSPVPEVLGADQQADACIVGAGIAGLSTAYLLVRAGRSVVVLDDGPIGGGETGRTTAHLSNVLDDRYEVMERLHGLRGARIAAESHRAAIDTIEGIAAAEQIACDFERLDGYLLALGTTPDGLRREMEAAQRAGLEAEWLDVAPVAGLEGPCVRFPDQGQFHPLRYLEGLAAAIRRRGGRIFAGDAAAHVTEIRRGEPATVVTAGGHVVVADAVVVATNSPVHLTVEPHTKQAPYRTYVVGLRVARGTVPRGLYWDMVDPYHYVRLQREDGHDVLIVGGEDHKTGQEADGEDRWEKLAAWAREHFPGAGEVLYRWSGQVMEPTDGIAFIGPDAQGSNIHVATGDSGMGMTHGTIAGMLLSDLIIGNPNAWAPLYDPTRKSLRGIGEFLKENVNVGAQYLDWATPGDVGDPAYIRPGTGAVIRHGLKKLAVYRDGSGQLHVLSAVCTHLGCIVAWNPDEATWDCPCHGSRFAADGHVVNGPAISALEEETLD